MHSVTRVVGGDSVTCVVVGTVTCVVVGTVTCVEVGTVLPVL